MGARPAFKSKLNLGLSLKFCLKFCHITISLFCPVARRRPCKKAPVSQDGAEEPEDKKQKRKTPLDITTWKAWQS